MSALGKANLLLALLAAEGAEDRLALEKRRSPRRVHRAARVEAVVKLPGVAELVERVLGHLLDAVFEALDPVHRNDRSVFAVAGEAGGGRGAAGQVALLQLAGGEVERLVVGV